MKLTAGQVRNLPESVRQQRAPLWRILEQSWPSSDRSLLEKDLVRKHQQETCVDQVAIP